MGFVVSKFTACIPIASMSGVEPIKYIEASMESCIATYNSKIIANNEMIDRLTKQAYALNRKGKKKEAVDKYKKAKQLQQTVETYQRQKDNMERQLCMSTDQRLTVDMMAAMKAHKDSMINQFGPEVVEQAEELMNSLKENNDDYERISQTLSEPITDTTEIEFDYMDDGALLDELDSIFEEKEDARSYTRKERTPKIRHQKEYSSKDHGTISPKKPRKVRKSTKRETRPKSLEEIIAT